MSAEIFAKRTVEQARGAAQRGEQRRRYRMDHALYDLVKKEKELSLSPALNALEQYLSWKNDNAVTSIDY